MLTIIGCGNPARGDDGVGVAIAKQLEARLRKHPVPGVQVFDCGTAGMEVMFAARGSDALIIIDACQSGSEPGALFEVPGPEIARPRSARDASLSLHDFRWDDALTTGAKIFGDSFPSEVQVFLVEAQNLDYSLELSNPVKATAQTLYNRLQDRIADYAAARHALAPMPRLRLKQGHLHVDQTLHHTMLEGKLGLLPFEDQGALCLMPVDELTGGLLLKQRNRQGDRVVDLGEFLRRHGWDDQGEHELAATWCSRLGALSLQMP